MVCSLVPGRIATSRSWNSEVLGSLASVHPDAVDPLVWPTRSAITNSENLRDRYPIRNKLSILARFLATLCERFTADLLEGKAVEEEPYRRNVAALSAVLIKLGMALHSRDVTKKGRPALDDFAAALIEANEAAPLG